MNSRGKNKSVTDEVFEWSFAVKSSRENEECIKPSSRLINSLGNEVTGKSFLELFLLLKRVVVLSVRHTATLEPTVKDFRHSPQHRSRD